MHSKSIFILLFTIGHLYGQGTISGTILDSETKKGVDAAHIILLKAQDSSFVSGTISEESGFFVFSKLGHGEYIIKASQIGYGDLYRALRTTPLTPDIHVGTLSMNMTGFTLDDIVIEGRKEEINRSMDRKNFNIEENLSQLGGSVLEALRNLPGVTIDRDGKVLLRGSDKVAVLMDGQQSALTGMSSQQALDNIPASAIERIEIINNPSAKYDATGMAGIINIIYKKDVANGWNGKVGINMGAGALGVKRANISDSRDQYQWTPKINPSASVTYRKDNINFFANGDVLLQRKLMKNEFTDRITSLSDVQQQYIENRDQPLYNFSTGIDYTINEKNKITLSGLYNNRAYIDRGDIAYLSRPTNERTRLWQYYEDEVNETIEGRINHIYQFKVPGKALKTMLQYAHRKKDETFYFDNFLINSIGTDTFFLTAAEDIYSFNVDYTQPLKKGRIEIGTQQRWQVFPNRVRFLQGINSIMDPGLAGSAEYREQLSAFYTNYIYDIPLLEFEMGLRYEYAKIDYLVDENHIIYTSDGFDYNQLFPNARVTLNLPVQQKISIFYNRRVNRPSESSLRSFPTYADPEILSLGNPNLIPQFSQNVETSYKKSFDKGYIYSAVYARFLENIITNIISQFPDSDRLTDISKNAGKGRSFGNELVASYNVNKKVKIDMNTHFYWNTIEAFTIDQKYPVQERVTLDGQNFRSGNIKLNVELQYPAGWKSQITAMYFAPDIIPQGLIGERYGIDLGMKKSISNGKGEIFVNATDIFNTMRFIREVNTTTLQVNSIDYYETQVFRVGYQFKW